MADKPTHEQNGGQGFGGGEQYERLEGSFTDGGAEPGRDEAEDRRFGAGKGLPEAPIDAPVEPPEGADGSPAEELSPSD